MLPALEAFFHPDPGGGQRLYLHHSPPAGQPIRGTVLYVHPWAEEMNKSRRMAALASRALARDGWAVLQVDLLGCGDSSGDFGDATWEGWVDDVTTAAAWLQRKHPGLPIWLWGLRAGALIATAAAKQMPSPVNFLFWQPVLQGKAALQQFLRLKAAAQIADGGGKAILDAIRTDLAAGNAVSIAGYTLSAGLARGLEAAVLSPDRAPGRALWLEVSNQADPTLSPAAQRALPDWQAHGWDVQAQAVLGSAFWQTTEIEVAEALVEATRLQIRQAAPLQAPAEAGPR